MARKFLYVIAGLIVLALASSVAYRLWGQQLIAATMVPKTAFEPIQPRSAADYADRSLWIARPDLPGSNPALFLPAGLDRSMAQRPAAIFFVHPTTYLAPVTRAKWNMPAGDADSRAMTARYVRSQASAFNGLGPVWAPLYRQAHFGVFLTRKPAAQRALDAAYGDVAAAFDAFLAANPSGPIILAGHSQGSLHLLRLLHDRIAGTPLASRIVAVYAIGWPVSLIADVPGLGLPACAARGQAGCIISWQSFAEPADPTPLFATYDAGLGFAGTPRKGTPMLCVNPLTGTPSSAAAASQNLGTLDERDPEAPPAGLIKGAVPARCSARGLLLIGEPPTLGPFVLPGNNYHVYDYALFWANIRRDAGERLATFLKP